MARENKHPEVGAAIKAYFKNKRISQKDAAKMLDVSHAAVSVQLLSTFGKNAASKWAHTFGFNKNFLLTGEGSLFDKDVKKRESPTEMKKVALLVSFVPMTRLVIEIPADKSLDEWLEDPYHLSKVSRTARAKMLRCPGDYLYADNIEIQEDWEMPAEEGETLDQDPDNQPL